MIRVLLVDDDALVRSGLRMMLAGAASLEVVAEAADGREVLGAVDLHRPDVVLMDIRMPHLDGIAATRLLAAQPDPPAVLVLTTFDADELVLALGPRRARCAGIRVLGVVVLVVGSDDLVEGVEFAACPGLGKAPGRGLILLGHEGPSRGRVEPTLAHLPSRATSQAAAPAGAFALRAEGARRSPVRVR